MTDEKKNEIWGSLPSDYQTYVKRWYEDVIDNNEQTEHIFEGLFGSHNLTAQSDETTQESPSHGENEPKTTVSEREMTQKSPSAVDYAQYRLDLAKEIAVAMIPNGWNMEIANRVVGLTNEIVKRLKETE